MTVKKIIQVSCLMFMAGGIIVTAHREKTYNSNIIMTTKSALSFSNEYSDRQHFPHYLMQEAEQYDFVLAEVTVSEENLDFNWIYGEDRDSLVQHYKTTKAEWLAQEEKEKADYWLFMKLKTDDVYDLDIWRRIKEEWSTASAGDDDISAFTDESGICAIKHFDEINRWSVYFKDDFLYVLECVDHRYSINEQLDSITLYYNDCMRTSYTHYSLWMSDENFYWRDHKDRVIYMENPDRSFYQVAGVDFSEGDRPCGILQKAEYTLALSEHTPEVKICLTLEEPLEDICLTAWGPADYPYSLEVSDAKTNELLLKDSVQMSADVVDAVLFTDSDGDGYLDMHIAYPDHKWVTELDYIEYRDRQEMSKPATDPACEYFACEYFASDTPTPESWFENWYYGDGTPETYSFARMYEPDSNEPEEEEIITVQRGDTLWQIAEKYFGDGRAYIDLYERNRDVIGDDPDMLLPGMELHL